MTAWHLLEWKYPGDNNSSIRTKIKDQNTILQICRHLAIGAKHFQPTRKNLKSVNTSGKGGVWAEGVWATWLEVKLENDAATELSGVIKVFELAEKVMNYWAAEIENSNGVT